MSYFAIGFMRYIELLDAENFTTVRSMHGQQVLAHGPMTDDVLTQKHGWSVGRMPAPTGEEMAPGVLQLERYIGPVLGSLHLHKVVAGELHRRLDPVDHVRALAVQALHLPGAPRQPLSDRHGSGTRSRP